jgi:hypothetical protein
MLGGATAFPTAEPNGLICVRRARSTQLLDARSCHANGFGYTGRVPGWAAGRVTDCGTPVRPG